MSGVDVAPGQTLATAEDVAGCCSGARWRVEDRAWKQLLPDLPDEVIAMLAPPVVVSAETLGGGAKTDDPAPVRPTGAHRATPDPRAPDLRRHHPEPAPPDPVQPRLAQPHPVQADPVQPHPVQADPVQAYPVQAYPVQAYPVQAYPEQEAPLSQASTLEPWPAWPLRAWPVLMAQVDQSLRFLAPAPPYRNTGRHSSRC